LIVVTPESLRTAGPSESRGIGETHDTVEVLPRATGSANASTVRAVCPPRATKPEREARNGVDLVDLLLSQQHSPEMSDRNVDSVAA
jgi:hypothetical protein